jgi:homospermidine synthase
MKIPFAGKIVIIGNGAVSKSLQLLLLNTIDYDWRRVTIVDQYFNADQSPLVRAAGAQFVQHTLEEHNYASFLHEHLKSGDVLIDLGVNIETKSLLEWCQHHNVLFINSSIEFWPLENKEIMDKKYSIYENYTDLFNHVGSWPKKGPTAIVDHGANPGLVSHWTKKALQDIAQHIIQHASTAYDELREALFANNFPEIARLTGTKIIQVSERDGQMIAQKKENEFVNTWCIEALHEECIAPVEINWGSHEKKIPANACLHATGPCHKLFFNKRAIHMHALSWVPSGPITGLMVRHGEVYTMGKYFSIIENHELIYRPTIYYVYRPSDAALHSLIETEQNGYKLQDGKRIINNDILSGVDELGVLLLGHAANGWWVGSELSIGETRSIAPGQNATALQVAAGVFGALLWLLENPRKGFKIPDDLPHDYIIDKTKKFLGNFSSRPVQWKPDAGNDEHFWQFEDYLVH